MSQRCEHLLGTTLNEKFTLVEIIGQGGQGIVFRAHQGTLRDVAVKVLPPPQNGADLAKYHETLARFQREAAIVARFDHPHIISIYDYGEQDDMAYLVMPYYAHGTLQEALYQRQLSLREVCVYTEQIAAALDYAHTQSVIHRDLKPGNCLFRAPGTLVLTDFGIARIYQEYQGMNWSTLTDPGVAVGTIQYMAPEILYGSSFDHRADIYSLGIVVYQLLSREFPFKGAPEAIAYQHLQKPLPDLREMNEQVSSAIDQTVRRAAAKDPQDRYASASSFAKALRQAMNTAPRPVAMPPLPPRFADPSSRLVLPSPTPQGSDAQTHPSALATPPPSHRTRPQSGRVSFLPLYLLVFLLILCAIAFKFVPVSTSALQAASTHVASPSEQAQGVVRRYYDLVNQHNYTAAYNLLDPAKRSNYCQFADSYASTESDTIKFPIAPQQQGNVWKVPVTIQATEYVASGTEQSLYSGTYLVENRSGSWQLGWNEPITLVSRTSVQTLSLTGSTSETQAQTLVQQYYNAVNQHDYPQAYNSWGIAYRQTNDYCGFLKGYAETIQDQIQIEHMTQQANGTITVTLTITATEQRGKGTQVKRYQWNATIGKEAGRWIIQNANQTGLP